MNKQYVRKGLALTAGVAMVAGLAACGGESKTTSEPEKKVDCSAYEVYGDLSGKTITTYTPWIDQEGDATVQAFSEFEQCTGATVEHEGSRDMINQLPVRVKAGSAPDLAMVAQPGWISTMVDTGKAVQPSAEAEANVDKYFSEDWKNYASVDGELWAVPMDAAAKSFIWYSPKAFEENGYEVPKTWDEMMDLTEKIAKDNAGTDVRPWTVGVEDGGGTGWPATDWLEDAVLRFAGGDVYDKWISHEIPFNDPAILDAFEKIGEILKNNDYVNGGYGDFQSIATTAWPDAGMSIVEGTGFMMRMAAFYQSNYTAIDDSIELSETGDAWLFQMPGKTEDEKAMTGGGDFAIAFSDRPEVLAFQAWLASPEYANARAAALPGWITANNGLDESLLKAVDKVAYEALVDPNTTFRFDASDAMPAEIGATTFAKQMTEYFAQDKSEKEVLDAIEEAWAKI